MEQENITINFFPLDLVGVEVPVFVCKNEPFEFHNSFTPQQLISLSELKLIAKEEKYWSFIEFDGSRRVSLEAKKEFGILKRYINHLIRIYFLKIPEVYVSNNFVGSVEVYEKSGIILHGRRNLNEFKRFIIRCEYWESTKRFGVIVSQGRKTCSTQDPYSAFGDQVAKDKINKVLFGNRVGRYEDFEKDSGFSNDNCYLLRSRALGDIFPQVRRGFTKENPYLPFLATVTQFFKKYLFEKNIAGFVSFSYSSLMQVPTEDIFRTSKESNLLSFKNGQTAHNVYNGLKEYGPDFVPEEAKKVRFFFIFHEQDKNLASKLFTYFSKGYRGFPGFAQFVGIPVTNENLDIGKTIKYKEDNPAVEIIEQLNKFDLSGNKYVAFYLSRIKKDEPNPEKRIAYYQIK